MRPSYEPSTRSLIRCSASGDTSAFARIVERDRARLLADLRCVAGRILGGDADEEDLYQRVLHRAWELLPGYEHRGSGSFFRWLSKIGRTIVAERVRYANAQRRDHGRTRGDSAFSVAQPDGSTSVPSRAARVENAARLVRALDAMGERERALLEAHVIDGRSLAELARDFDIPRSTVWHVMREAKCALRAILGEPANPDRRDAKSRPGSR